MDDDRPLYSAIFIVHGRTYGWLETGGKRIPAALGLWSPGRRMEIAEAEFRGL
jgi:hypothetical protein